MSRSKSTTNAITWSNGVGIRTCSLRRLQVFSFPGKEALGALTAQEGPTEVAHHSGPLRWSVGCRVLLQRRYRILVQYGSEDPSQVRPGHFVVLDVDALEHRLIEVTPDLRIVAAEVATVCPIEMLECDVQRSVETFVVHLGLSKPGLNHSTRNGDPALLLLREIDWQCIRVVGLHQLVCL